MTIPSAVALLLLLTALATGIAVASFPIRHWSEPGLALIPAGILADSVGGSWTPTSNEEIIVTTPQGVRLVPGASGVRELAAGEPVGYGASFVAERHRFHQRIDLDLQITLADAGERRAHLDFARGFLRRFCGCRLSCDGRWRFHLLRDHARGRGRGS